MRINHEQKMTKTQAQIYLNLVRLNALTIYTSYCFIQTGTSVLNSNLKAYIKILYLNISIDSLILGIRKLNSKHHLFQFIFQGIFLTGHFFHRQFI